MYVIVESMTKDVYVCVSDHDPAEGEWNTFTEV